MAPSPNILCTICARGGSKGIPGKNLRRVAGDPLVGHAITDAKEWGRCDEVIVSSDSRDIADVAMDYGADVPFDRPAALATDDAPKLDVLKHALSWMHDNRAEVYDYVVDLDPTAPLRTVQDIEDCFEVVRGDERATNAYTVCEAAKNPYFNMVELDEDGYASLSKSPDDAVKRRQDAPTVYEMNAAVYVYRTAFLRETESIHGPATRVSVMPPERSVDIDSELDLSFVEFMLARGDVDT